MLTLKQGDNLEKDCFDNRNIIEVVGSLVAYEDCGIKWMRIEDIERDGWKIRKTRWVPESGERYYYGGDIGIISGKVWNGSYADLYRLSIGNCFESLEQAEAYRSELIERGKLNV